MRTVWNTLALLIIAALPLRSFGEGVRVQQLESEVRRLQRQLDSQARRIDALERRGRIPGDNGAPAAAAASADSSPAWLIGTNWDRVEPGMKVVDVVALLGRPTSVRSDSAGRVQSLWYAMELGPSAVISGNVELDGAGVTRVNRPILR